MLTHLFRILKYGTSYAIATGFFPKKIAQDVIILYSFVRIPDNIVDSPIEKGGQRGDQKNPERSSPTLQLFGWYILSKEGEEHYSQAKIKLEKLYYSRREVYELHDTKDAQRGQYVDLFLRNNIPFQYSNAFFKAMIDDCSLHRYETYEQLEKYMYWSASVVGLMMCHLIGFTDPADEETAKSYATELGNAMQLTNFLRDVREDYEDLGRIYVPLFPPLARGDGGIRHSESDLPLTPLSKRGISHEDITEFCHWWYAKATQEQKQQRADTMKVYIAQCRTMYAHSLDGLQYLKPEWRKAVRLAALLYEAILDKIEVNKYDVFTRSARTTLRDKAKVLYRYTRW